MTSLPPMADVPKLEHYFLAHQEAEAKSQRYQQEQQRAESLIETLLSRLETKGL
jgi:hypothetical protein